MKRRIAVTMLGLGMAASGCAEILGLEPPGGGGGGSAGAGTGAGGTRGTGGPLECKLATDGALAGLPACQVPKCVDGKCQSVPASDGDAIPCYTGDPATQGIGNCHPGQQLCQGGMPVTSCMDQVV